MEKRIFWIGDSTVHFNRVDTWPQRGMGQELEAYLRPGVVVYDYAENGRSTKSFWDQGLFEPVREAMKAGDFLFIQFGRNSINTYCPCPCLRRRGRERGARAYQQPGTRWSAP